MKHARTIRVVSESIPQLSVKHTVLAPKIKLDDFILFLEKLQALRVNFESSGLIKCNYLRDMTKCY